MAASYDIVIRCDRDYYYPVSVITSLGNPANLTGYVVNLTVKASVNDPDAKALFKSQPATSNLAFGQFTFQIPRGVNKAWWIPGSGPVSSSIVYDVSCQDIAAVPNWTTLIEGNVGLIPPVTVTVS